MWWSLSSRCLQIPQSQLSLTLLSPGNPFHCGAGLTSGPVPVASLHTSPTQPLLNSIPLRLEPKNNTEAIVSAVKTKITLIFLLYTVSLWVCNALLGCVLLFGYTDKGYLSNFSSGGGFLHVIAWCDLHIWIGTVGVCAEKGSERGKRDRYRECPRVRLRPWVTSSRAAASASNLTGNFFILASKPQSQTLPPTSMSLSSPRHSTPSPLFSFIPLLWKSQRLEGKYERPTTPRAAQLLLQSLSEGC